MCSAMAMQFNVEKCAAMHIKKARMYACMYVCMYVWMQVGSWKCVLP